MKKFKIALSAFLGILAIYLVAIFITNPVSEKDKDSIKHLIILAYEKAGIDNPNWQTLILAATREVDIPKEKVWDAWAELEDWPSWSDGLHQSTKWIGDKKWEKGSEFEQVLNLGFPIGILADTDKVDEVIPYERVIWWSNKDGIKACHIWSFEERPNGKVRVTNCEVFHGFPIALIKPILAKNWH